MLTLRAVGRFELLDAAGADHSPNSRKACGVLAMLALSPGWRRSRRWLQEKLWSDRGSEQAAASLRQALRDIRRHLGTHSGILRSDRLAVSLDAKLLSISFQLDTGPGPGEPKAALFEDLHIADPKFQDWIQCQRKAITEGRDLAQGSSDGPSRNGSSIPSRQTAILFVTTGSGLDGFDKRVARQSFSLTSDAMHAQVDPEIFYSAAPRISSHDPETDHAVVVEAMVNDLGALVSITVRLKNLTSKCHVYAEEIRVSGQSSAQMSYSPGRKPLTVSHCERCARAHVVGVTDPDRERVVVNRAPASG